MKKILSIAVMALLVSACVAGGTGGGGGNKWGLIALGALLLVGVGGFLMFGKK